MTYAKSRRDFEYLETIAELDDWVPLMDELVNFMRNPTKAFANDLYTSAIGLWFGEHGAQQDARSRKIAKDYGGSPS